MCEREKERLFFFKSLNYVPDSSVFPAPVLGLTSFLWITLIFYREVVFEAKICVPCLPIAPGVFITSKFSQKKENLYFSQKKENLHVFLFVSMGSV